MNRKIKAAIIGATGYTGREAIIYLLRHRGVELKRLFALDYLDRPISEAFPILTGMTDLRCQELDLELVKDECDAAFLCLPHTVAMEVAGKLVGSKTRVIDLSADFRFSDVKVYNRVYGVKHEYPKLLEQAVYGIPELNREQVKGCNLLANPGCYPTSVILPLYPLLREKLIAVEGIIIDAKSGVSGAGRKVAEALIFAEVNESLKAYSPGKHRHQPEIEEQLGQASGGEVRVTFVPHLIPMTRGMLSTIYCRPQTGIGENQVRKALNDYYEKEFFVQALAEGTLPRTADVAGTNFCHIGFAMAGEGLVICSAIDNLGKGASGQAVQNFNVMFGFDEKEGLV